MADPLHDAIAAINAGDHAAAEAILAAALREAPGHPVLLTLLGIALIEQDRAAEAREVLGRALAASPGNPRVLLPLARAERLLGCPADAVAHYRALLASGMDEPALHLELALALLDQDDREGAEQRLRAGLGAPSILRAEAGERAALHHALGNVLKTRRAFDEALDALDEARTGHPDPVRLAKDRAGVLQHLRRFDDAAEVLGEAVALAPLDLDAHLQLNEMLYRQGRDEAFLRSYDDAARRVPASPLLPVARAQLLLRLGDLGGAAAAYRQALQLAPGHAAARIGLARVLERQDAGLAHDAYASAVAQAPGDPAVLVACGSFLLRDGDARGAQSLAERAHDLDPEGQEALALLTLAYRASGDAREERLAAYDDMVRVFDLEPPPGFADMAAFNAELAAYLDDLHGDRREHVTQTLRGGTRLYDAVFHNGHALADVLRGRIDQAVARYIAEWPLDASHPVAARRRGGFRYAGSWSSRMGDRGYHLNHLHPDGWISSAYYARVPGDAGEGGARAGWLKFGEPDESLGAAFAPRHWIEPRVGRLVLFPSYFWHGTIPFTSTDSRVTIAFDVTPV